MTRHTGQSAENHGSDQGTHRLKGAVQLAIDDAARSEWLNVAMRERATQLKAEKALSRENGRRGGNAAAARPKTRKGWTCGNCGARNRLFIVCIDCRAVRGT